MSLEDTVRDLLETGVGGRNRRRQFYKDPNGYLHREAPHLSHEDRAILFTMNRRLIADRLPREADKIRGHRFSGHWDAQGKDWPAPDPGDFQDPGTYPTTFQITGQPLPLAEAGGGSAWGDPGPHGRGFKPQTATVDKTFELTLVGEGLMDLATVVFEHIDWAADNAGPHAFPVNKAAYRNFRCCYLKVDVKIESSWPVGRYTITIQNDPGNPDTYIRAGHFFIVTPNPEGDKVACS